ncbi:uncharacterized protein RHIMIDRAFT_265373 [Rhizopus microsporus ATCC 52813]|uniref:Uncharacterized protein n=1 Tax=Rhizopus microsporus ATCC 52813 TaxID=1340429 RepID=A0A2G4T656_RHIZD|nr:uncharacterized protein RHIMIDRAFT_265373 [Rhizopus microsporus ATCC 52813]PHZ16166.1 hypothetical protein RHIMIDRAFT_265373 [Rhizopus microsporus ATCC 52813]
MNLQYEHLYTFTEITSMKVPLKKSDLLNLCLLLILISIVAINELSGPSVLCDYWLFL